MDYLSEGLLNGICVIIDDEVDEVGTPANDLATSIKSEGMLVATYTHLPQEEIISSLGNASFIILDWDYSNADLPEGVSRGENETEEAKEQTIMFLQTIQTQYFIPIFIITGKEIHGIKQELINYELFSEEEPNRIMLKTKDDIPDYSALIDNIEQWLVSMPSAVALKVWEKEANSAKHKMFNELYNASPAWVRVLRDTLAEDMQGDAKALDYDFQSMLNNNFVNRMKAGKYTEIDCDKTHRPKRDVIRNIIEGERFIRYDGEQPETPYVGDLYKSNNADHVEYYLNIRAQCSLLHEDNPIMYIITGERFDESTVNSGQRIKIKKNTNENIIQLYHHSYTIEELGKLEKDDIKEFNSQMRDKEQKPFFSNGEFLAKKNEAYLSCIDNQFVIKFEYKSFETKTIEQLNDKATRIGRLIPPYITKIQQECAAYIIREGIMPLPRNLFFDNE